MLKSYRNKLLMHIKSKEYLTKEMDFEEINHGIKISLNNSPLSFLIFNSEESFHHFEINFTGFNPGFKTVGDSNVDFNLLLENFDEWFENDVEQYLDELAEPDLWKVFLEEYDGLIKGSLDESQEFSELDRNKVTLAIENLRNSIEGKMDLNTEKLEKIDKKLEALTKKLDSFNKTDWKDYANGIIMNIATSIILEPTQREVFFNLLKQSFNIFPRLLGG